MKLQNKRILLTGADGGIGAQIASKLDKQGCELILVGLDQDRLDQLNQSLGKDLPAKHCVFAVDLSQQEGVKSLFEKVQELGGIDGLINNAGISEFTFIEQQDANALERLIKINLVSPMRLCQTFIGILKQHDEAFIVNMGSTFGSIGYPGFSALCCQ